jgi:hypothetical protein
MTRLATHGSRIGKPPRRPTAAALFAWSVLLSPAQAPPALAFDLFATHEVTAQFATADGKPLAGAEVRVFAPGEPTKAYTTGHTDAAGKFVFDADRDGIWAIEARTPTEIARITKRVGGGPKQPGWIEPWFVIGGLLLLLAAAFWYRLRRMRPPKF